MGKAYHHARVSQELQKYIGFQFHGKVYKYEEQVLTADRHIGDNEVHKVIRLENIKTEVLNKCIKNIRGFGLEIVYNELDNPNHSSQTQTIDTEMKKMDRNCQEGRKSEDKVYAQVVYMNNWQWRCRMDRRSLGNLTWWLERVKGYQLMSFKKPEPRVVLTTDASKQAVRNDSYPDGVKESERFHSDGQLHPMGQEPQKFGVANPHQTGSKLESKWEGKCDPGKRQLGSQFQLTTFDEERTWLTSINSDIEKMFMQFIQGSSSDTLLF
ncbi:MAG: hypothetical protein EZS28_024882, partial [Streblomastix strix]